MDQPSDARSGQVAGRGPGVCWSIPSPDLMAITPRQDRKLGHECCGSREPCGLDEA